MSATESDLQNLPQTQEPRFTQMCESSDTPLQNTTTDMLSELAMKFHTMKNLQSTIKDFFALDQKCCIEFLEKILEELKKPQNVQSSADLRVNTSRVEENRSSVCLQAQNATRIVDSNNLIREVPSASVNSRLYGETSHSVDRKYHERVWTLANRISDSVSRALMSDEASKNTQNQKPQSRLCYQCRSPGHIATACPKNKNKMSLPNGFSDVKFHRTQKNKNNKLNSELERTKHKSQNLEVSHPSPRKKAKVSFPDRVCYACRLPGHLASACPKNTNQ